VRGFDCCGLRRRWAGWRGRQDPHLSARTPTSSPTPGWGEGFRRRIAGVIADGAFRDYMEPIGEMLAATGLPRFPIAWLIDAHLRFWVARRAAFDRARLAAQIAVPATAPARRKRPAVPAGRRAGHRPSAKDATLTIFKDGGHCDVAGRDPERYLEAVAPFVARIMPSLMLPRHQTRRNPMHTVRVADVTIGPQAPLAIIAGPCVAESRDLCLKIGAALRDRCAAWDWATSSRPVSTRPTAVPRGATAAGAGQRVVSAGIGGAETGRAGDDGMCMRRDKPRPWRKRWTCCKSRRSSAGRRICYWPAAPRVGR